MGCWEWFGVGHSSELKRLSRWGGTGVELVVCTFSVFFLFLGGGGEGGGGRDHETPSRPPICLFLLKPTRAQALREAGVKADIDSTTELTPGQKMRAWWAGHAPPCPALPSAACLLTRTRLPPPPNCQLNPTKLLNPTPNPHLPLQGGEGGEAASGGGPQGGGAGAGGAGKSQEARRGEAPRWHFPVSLRYTFYCIAVAGCTGAITKPNSDTLKRLNA